MCWLTYFLYSPGDGKSSSITLDMASTVPINVTCLRLLWVLGAVNTNGLSKFRLSLEMQKPDYENPLNLYNPGNRDAE